MAAIECAAGAALLAMVAALTIGRKRYRDVEDEAQGIRERALALRDLASALSSEDIAAYGRVAEAMRLPRDSDEERAIRTEGVQVALKEAVRPPLRTMEVGMEILRLGCRLVEIGNQSAVSDVGTAALSARTGFYAAQLNVEINLAAIRDDLWVADARRSVSALGTPDEMEQRVLSATRRSIAGGAR